MNRLLMGVALLSLFFAGCNSRENESPKMAKEASKAETRIFMHSRMGIRMELNLDKKQLDLWISPKATTSVDNFDRNFSNRDDHTGLFDRVTFPNLSVDDFIKCDYDAFHSVVHFKNQQMHIASLWDQPVVMVWFEKPEHVDFKTDKADRIISRSPNTLLVAHPDRGYDFEFMAAFPEGGGNFKHMLQTEIGRSIYARAELNAQTPLFIGGALKNEQLNKNIAQLLTVNKTDLLAKTEQQVNSVLHTGRAVLKNDTTLQRLLDVNKRVYISMQDASGSVRAAIQSIYYMIWVRDGGMSSAFLGQAGWVETLDKFAEYLLANPTVIDDEQPQGRMFGQLTNQKINKWEEDGAFYAIWTAFAHWTQTGDRKYVSGNNLKLLEESMDWLERYCYDADKKAFGRYYFCETPFVGTRDDGWDNAVGFPVTGWSPGPYEGKMIKRSYDMYINSICFANYTMLASMQTDEAKRDLYLQKADNLKPFIRSFYKEGDIPDYGLLQAHDSTEFVAKRYGLDRPDHQWGLSLPFFVTDYHLMPDIHKILIHDLINKPSNVFLSAWFSILASVDIEFSNPDTLWKAVQYPVAQCVEPGTYLPMPYTMVEMTDQEQGNPYHDIRPQGFTIAAWLSAVSNFGVKRLPFGIAPRSNPFLSRIENYEYKQSVIDFEYSGEGEFSKLLVNGTELTGTMQLPEQLLKPGKNTVELIMGQPASKQPCIVSSTVQLNKVESNGLFHVTAYGNNAAIIKSSTKVKIEVADAKGNKVNTTLKEQGLYTYLQFEGAGDFTITIL